MDLEVPYAFGGLLDASYRYKVYYGGRGSGKSHTFARVLLAIGCVRKIGVLCARELQVSIKDSVHSLLSSVIDESDVFRNFYEVKSAEIIGANGTRFSFKGLRHNVSEIKSYEGVDYCWVEEAQSVSDRSWEVLVPTIRKPRSEIWLSFNPKSPSDPTYKRFVLGADSDVLVQKVSWRDNPYFPEVLNKERLKLQRQDALAYAHIWEGEFDDRHDGAVYARCVNPAQVSDATVYDSSLPIYTAWDLGYDDATSVIWFQVARGEVRVIDAYENNMEDVKHYCEQLYGAEIIVKRRDEYTGRVVSWEFGKRLDDVRSGYDYTGGKHYVPHDAAHKLQAAGGRSIVEQAGEFGVRMEVVGATTHQQSEAALKGVLPRCWFNKGTTGKLVESLMSYHYEWDDEKLIYGKVPVHDWSSHFCDAAEIMARAWRDYGSSMEDIRDRRTVNAFHSARRKSNMVRVDPYRVKPLFGKGRSAH